MSSKGPAAVACALLLVLGVVAVGAAQPPTESVQERQEESQEESRQGEPPAAATFEQSYELVMVLETPEETRRHTLLLGGPSFSAQLGMDFMSGRLSPNRPGSAHLEYRFNTGSGRSLVSSRATVLLPDGTETAIISTEGLTVRVLVRPAP